MNFLVRHQKIVFTENFPVIHFAALFASLVLLAGIQLLRPLELVDMAVQVRNLWVGLLKLNLRQGLHPVRSASARPPFDQYLKSNMIFNSQEPKNSYSR
jgi:hypothetical protein